MNKLVLGSLLAVVNIGGGFVAYYDLTLVSIILMASLALILMIATLNRIKSSALQNEQIQQQSEKYYLDEEQVRASYLRFYSLTNDSIQFMRNVIVVSNPLLTLSVLISLYLISIKAYYFGDFMFIIIFCNIIIAVLYLMSGHKQYVKQQHQKTKEKIMNCFNNLVNTIPRHVVTSQ